MTDPEFMALAERALARVEDAIDRLSQDADAQRTGNVLSVELESGEKVIVNIQQPMREIWVAARSGGFHYRWDGAAWRDTRSGEELFAALARIVGEPVG